MLLADLVVKSAVRIVDVSQVLLKLPNVESFAHEEVTAGKVSPFVVSGLLLLYLGLPFPHELGVELVDVWLVLACGGVAEEVRHFVVVQAIQSVVVGRCLILVLDLASFIGVSIVDVHDDLRPHQV